MPDPILSTIGIIVVILLIAIGICCDGNDKDE